MDNALPKVVWQMVAVACLVGLCATQAEAQVVFYTDEGMFDAANPGLDVEDFEAGEAGVSSVECPSPIAAEYPNPNALCFPANTLLPRIMVASATSFQFEGLQLWAAEGPVPSQAVSVADTSASQGIRLYLPGGAQAVGFDIFTDVIGLAPFSVSVYGQGDNLLDAAVAEGSIVGTFFGISSSQYIYRVEIHSDTELEGVDNVKFDAGLIFHDGFESGDLTVWTCDDYDGDGMTSCGGDCDDSDPFIPNSFELCGDGRDNDCSGAIDDCCDPLLQECPNVQACYPILRIPQGFPPQSACAGPSQEMLGQGEVCQFINSCREGYGCALIDLLNPDNLLCAFTCDADDGVPGCQDFGGPGAGFVCARLEEFYSDVSSEQSWGMCIPEDLTCGDTFCQPWETVGTCPADCP